MKADWAMTCERCSVAPIQPRPRRNAQTAPNAHRHQQDRQQSVDALVAFSCLSAPSVQLTVRRVRAYW